MSTRALTVLMCTFLGLTLLGLHGFPALLPEFVALWDLSNSQAGWLNGAPYLAYTVIIPLLAISDRIDAKRILMAGAAAGAVGYTGFALFADGFWSALAFRCIQGIGLAGTYMPGVKALSDRIAGNERARASSLYVSSFGICSSFSVLLAAEIAAPFGWRWAFVLPGVTHVVALILVWAMLPPSVPVRPAESAARRPLLDFRPALRNRKAMAFVLGGFAHSVELLGLRGWTVAFLVMAAPAVGLGAHLGAIPAIATGLILLGTFTSFVGSELGHRFGFAAAGGFALLLSGMAALAVGFSPGWGATVLIVLVLVHNLFVLADSGALNGGTIAAATAEERGATVALYAFANAIGGLLGPILFGTVLDAASEGAGIAGWGLAFASLGAVAVTGSLIVIVLGRDRSA